MRKGNFPELDELAEQVGGFIRYWGFKKVHGEIWLHLYLSEHPLDAADLMSRLKISKALVSISLADLLEYKVVLPAGKSSKGTLVYETNPDLMEAILNVLRTRERKMLSHIQASYRQVKKMDSKEQRAARLDSVKLKQLGEFLAAGEEMLDAFLQFQPINLGAWEKFTATDAEESK